MSEKNLRDYQIEVKSQIHAAWNGGMRGVMCQMPTGTGKTVVAVSIIRETLSPKERISDQVAENKSVLVVAHRKEILDQMKETLKRYGLARELKEGRIVVESIQKLAAVELKTGNGKLKSGNPLCPSLVVIDEAHHATARTYRMLWEMWPEARFLGMTATPCRLKKEGFTDLFDKLVCSWPVKRFISEGWLADYEYITVKADSDMRSRINGLKKRGVDGDYQVKEMGSVLDNRASIAQLYRSYEQFARGRQGIVYAINREHANHIADFYSQQYENDKTKESKNEIDSDAVAVIDSGTPKKERAQILEDYKAGKVRILVNCEIYTEGYDAPFVEFIQMARPTLSLSKYLQQVGRGLRPNKDGMKTVILDNVGMYYMFGLPSADRNWDRMFRDGQGLLTNSSTKTRTIASENVNATATEEMTDGHDLGMTVIDKDMQERVESGKAVVVEYKRNDKDVCYRMTLNGKNVTEAFEVCSGFMDGVVCFEQHKGSAGDKFYYDDEGNPVAVFPHQSELLPDGIIKAETSYDVTGYYDARMCTWLPCLPNLYNKEEASFVEEMDGWHVRSRKFNYMGFRKEDISVITTQDGQRLVTMKDAGTDVSYVCLPKGRQVMAFLGMEDDGTLILANGINRDVIFTWAGKRLTPHRKSGSGHELYARWEEKLVAVPLDRNCLHLTIGTDYHLQAFIDTDSGLSGWYLENRVLCEAKFTEIKKFVDGKYVLAKLLGNDNTVVADLHGNVLYDKHHVYYLTGDWAHIQVSSGTASGNRVNLVSGAYIEEGEDKLVCGPFCFEAVQTGWEKTWCPKGWPKDKLGLSVLDLKDGVLYAYDNISCRKVLAFEKDPSKFYRVLKDFGDGRYEVREVMGKELYIYEKGSLPRKKLIVDEGTVKDKAFASRWRWGDLR